MPKIRLIFVVLLTFVENTMTQTPSLQKENNRLFALDLLRVLACFLVVWQHITECYYINPDMTIPQHEGMPLIGWMNSMTPIEVPLFVMISGYFLLPLKMDVGAFFKRRFTRILIPFVVWCVIYAAYYMVSRGDTFLDFVRNVAHIPVNFGVEIGHMWFIYMLLGLYMLVPVLSPWLEQCSKRQLQGYLGVWIFTTCLPYIHLWFPQVLGECFWNPTPMLHYFTGFAGYFVLGYYIKRYGALSVRNAWLMLAGGYLFTVAVYQYRLGRVTMVSDLEVCWRFCGVNMAVMAYAVFSLVSRIKWQGTDAFGRWISQVSSLSYAIFFVHLILVFTWHGWLGESLKHVYIQIPVLTVGAFLSSYAIVWVLSKLPKAKVWLGS